MKSQPVRQRGRFARHARVREAADDGRRHLQVAGGPAVVAGEFGRVQAEAQALPVEQRARLRSRLAVDQPQPRPATSSSPRTRVPGRTTRPSRQEANPTTSAPPGISAAAPGSAASSADVPALARAPTWCTPATCTSPAAASRSASLLPHGHQANASGGSSSGERRLEQRQRRVAAGHHHGGPRRPDGPYRHQVPRPRRAGADGAAGDQPAAGRSPAGGPRAGQRHERVADGGERDPGTRAADRRDRPRQHRIAEVTGAEKLLDRHAEGAGQAEGDPQRGIRVAGLDSGHRLPGDPGHAGQLLLGQAASVPGQPQPRPVRLGVSVMSPLSFLGYLLLTPKARPASTRSVTRRPPGALHAAIPMIWDMKTQIIEVLDPGAGRRSGTSPASARSSSAAAVRGRRAAARLRTARDRRDRDDRDRGGHRR